VADAVIKARFSNIEQMSLVTLPRAAGNPGLHLRVSLRSPLSPGQLARKASAVVRYRAGRQDGLGRVSRGGGGS